MTNNRVIHKFIGTYEFLSNFYVHPVVSPLGIFRSGEHMFQWHKTVNMRERSQIKNAPTPALAKRRGRTCQMRPGWDMMKLEVMASVLSAKFADPVLRNLLLSTIPYKLVEGNMWHDNTWGNCECAACTNITGQNDLGQLLGGLRLYLVGARVLARTAPRA